MAVDKKTRTSSAHGPASAKSAYKAKSVSTPAGKKPYTSKPPPPKSANTDLTSTRPKRKADDEDEVKSKPAPVASLLNAPKEIDFPRGGGTNLTQVEVYEAQLEGDNEARKEVEDEVSIHADSTVGLHRMGELTVVEVVGQAGDVGEDGTVGGDKTKAKRRKLERALKAEVKEKNVLPKDAFRVEHLNYKVPPLSLLRPLRHPLALADFRAPRTLHSASSQAPKSSPRLFKSAPLSSSSPSRTNSSPTSQSPTSRPSTPSASRPRPTTRTRTTATTTTTTRAGRASCPSCRRSSRRESGSRPWWLRPSRLMRGESWEGVREMRLSGRRGGSS